MKTLTMVANAATDFHVKRIQSGALARDIDHALTAWQAWSDRIFPEVRFILTFLALLAYGFALCGVGLAAGLLGRFAGLCWVHLVRSWRFWLEKSFDEATLLEPWVGIGVTAFKTARSAMMSAARFIARNVGPTIGWCLCVDWKTRDNAGREV